MKSNIFIKHILSLLSLINMSLQENHQIESNF